MTSTFTIGKHKLRINNNKKNLKTQNCLCLCFRIQALQKQKNDLLSLIKEAEDKIQEETGEVDKYRAERSKYQQHLQHITALQSRIRIAEDKIKQMEEDRTSVDDIKAACTKEIKVCFLQSTPRV